MTKAMTQRQTKGAEQFMKPIIFKEVCRGWLLESACVFAGDNAGRGVHPLRHFRFAVSALGLLVVLAPVSPWPISGSPIAFLAGFVLFTATGFVLGALRGTRGLHTLFTSS